MSLWLSHPLFLPSIIVGVTILLWATSLLPEFMTALLFFAAVVAMGPVGKFLRGRGCCDVSRWRWYAKAMALLSCWRPSVIY